MPDWADFLVIAGIFYLTVLGLNVLMGHAGQVSLGQTAFLAIGAYGSGLLTLRLGWPSLVAALAALLASIVLAIILGRSFLRLRGYYLALATLGLAVITQGLASALGGITGGPSGLVGIPNLAIGPLAFTDAGSYYYLVLVLCAAGAWFARNLVTSQSGRALAAIASDQAAASMLGVNPAAYKTRAFVLSAGYASIAGSVYADFFRFFSPDLVSVTVAFSLVIMLAIGGARSIAGPLIGVLLLQLIPRAGQQAALYEPLAAGIVLILVMTYFPAGLWGGVRRLWVGARDAAT
jgi:branched-chain amino acid transport system permease protein